MTDANEICRMDAVTLAAKIRSRELSAIEVTVAALARMEKLEPILQAFCTPTPDLAIDQARRIEAEIAAGRDPGPVAGVPASIKDLILTKGIRTASGSAAYENFVPDEDDVAVERLKAAGAIILGKTNVPEFGYSATGHNPIFETTRNPWNTTLTSGGSSAGAAVAVATGMGPLAVGSDGGGSVRIPASFCGLYGFKPSFGRIPLYPGARDERYPGVSGWESLECYGPLTRTVADAALMTSVMAGPDMRDRHSLPPANFDWIEALKGDLKGKRIAYSRDWGYAAVEPEVLRIADAAVKVFERDLGCIVEQANPGWDDPARAFAGVVVAETDLAGMRTMLDRYESRMSPHLVDLLRMPWTAEDFTNANVGRKALVNKMWRFMMRYDLLLTPTLAVPPFPILMQGPDKIAGQVARASSWLCFTFPINLTGQPAATVPAGFTSDALPVGLQIIGRHLDDPMVLRASACFEAARPWRDKWPPLLDKMRL
ncbi:MAG: amidase [Candidatus Binataceae bacterium]|nr:amidase [Candidatus Binataceae bacterium]